MTAATIAALGGIVAIIAAWGEYKKHNTSLATENRLTSLEHRMTVQEEKSEK